MRLAKSKPVWAVVYQSIQNYDGVTDEISVVAVCDSEELALVKAIDKINALHSQHVEILNQFPYKGTWRIGGDKDSFAGLLATNQNKLAIDYWNRYSTACKVVTVIPTEYLGI